MFARASSDPTVPLLRGIAASGKNVLAPRGGIGPHGINPQPNPEPGLVRDARKAPWVTVCVCVCVDLVGMCLLRMRQRREFVMMPHHETYPPIPMIAQSPRNRLCL